MRRAVAPALAALALTALALTAAPAALPDGLGSGGGRPAGPTFTRDVAPIVHANCMPCHYEGGPGPFSLVSYADVRRRARQIARITRDRVMPPWPPVEGHGSFKGERRLSPDQIATLARWAEQGAVEGAAADLRPVEVPGRGWAAGEPDIVLTADAAWTLPAEGEDVFRNFVLPVPVTTRRYVRMLEIRPGNARIVHHANALPDRSGMGRERDASDPLPGFSGMDLEIASDRFEPDSHFLFWKPGTPREPGARRLPWVLEPGTDLILNLHLRPSGKAEPVRPSVGLYFTDEAPTEFPMLLQLEHDGAIDIPAGASGVVVSDELRLPVDVQVLAVYPHAHYVARSVEATARRPDGTTQWLIHIDDWNLDWQAVYELATPMPLPAGTVISMRWTYDNSDRNERNPSSPPAHVRAGNRAADEMSHLWLQVLPRRREDHAQLQDALMRRRLRKYPGDFTANANLGALMQSEGRLDLAIAHLRAAVASRPDHAGARNNLATALLAAGRTAEAEAELRAVTRTSPEYLQAHYNLAHVLLAQGRAQDAAAHFERVVSKAPTDAAALRGLGGALAMSGRMAEAQAALLRAVELDPSSAQAHYNLGLLAASGGRYAEAVTYFERAAALDPSDGDIAQALKEARTARDGGR